RVSPFFVATADFLCIVGVGSVLFLIILAPLPECLICCVLLAMPFLGSLVDFILIIVVAGQRLYARAFHASSITGSSGRHMSVLARLARKVPFAPRRFSLRARARKPVVIIVVQHYAASFDSAGSQYLESSSYPL